MTVLDSRTGAAWRSLCQQTDLVAQSGVVAWADGRQIALIYLPHAPGQTLFAIDNRDPMSGANVIGRGIVCELGGELVIASPLYKQHFRLRDGTCLEDPEQQLQVWPVRLQNDQVQVDLS
jgi:nitrite reductase (NADH) small subunit